MYDWVLKKIIFFTLLLSLGSIYAGDIQHIDNQTLKELMLDDVPVIDIRTKTEWIDTGVIENSHLLMFYDEKGKFDLDRWLANVEEIAGKDSPVILICHSGSRSKQLAKYLTKVVGYEKVYNVKRGIHYWIKKNNNVVQLQ